MLTETKSTGGIVGFSTKQGAFQRWILTAHDRANMTKSCRTLAGLVEESSVAHKETQPMRLERDESLFDVANGNDLVFLSSGISATDKVRADLETAFE